MTNLSVPSRYKRGCGVVALLVSALLAAATAFVWFQARHTPAGNADYVALGSSFAAGAGLGALQDDSPLLCARTQRGYPQLLARKLGLSIVDMSCSGAKTSHLVDGGQFFQGPQIRAITSKTRLVTMTIGGNDVAYAGDLSLLAARNGESLLGSAARALWRGPEPAKGRGYKAVERKLTGLLQTVRSKAPDAVVVVATYPTILPKRGTCPRLGLTEAEADFMRDVGERLAAATRRAAAAEGALLVDMHAIGADHHACSKDPWTSGWSDLLDAPFHPNRQGAKATAEAIAAALARHQQV